MNALKLTAGMLLLTLLGGCAGAAMEPIHDPAYAPTMPAAARPTEQNGGGIFQPGQGMLLHEDIRARNVGDLLTVQLVEQTDASKSASTSTSKDQEVGIDAGTLFGRQPVHNGVPVLETTLGAGRSFNGDGQTSQSNSISGSITVTVAEVLPNGNLVVRGEKVLSLNEGDEYVRLSGIVRPADITPQNTVQSTQLANTQITYGGRGAISDSNQMGWLARFFNSVLWPF